MPGRFAAALIGAITVLVIIQALVALLAHHFVLLVVIGLLVIGGRLVWFYTSRW